MLEVSQNIYKDVTVNGAQHSCFFSFIFARPGQLLLTTVINNNLKTFFLQTATATQTLALFR